MSQPFAVAVPTLTRYDLLCATIDGITKQSMRPEKVFVIDNGRDFHSHCASGGLCRWPFSVIVIVPDYNWGTAKAWNAAAKLAAPMDVVFCNDDITFNSEFALEEIVNDPKPVCHGAGWCLFRFAQSVFNEVGLFDEAIWPVSSEDTDMAIRLQIGRVPQTDKSYKNLATNHSATTSTTVLGQPQWVARNRDYVIEKWGATIQNVDGWRFKLPFDGYVPDLLEWEIAYRDKCLSANLREQAECFKGIDEIEISDVWVALAALAHRPKKLTFSGGRRLSTEILLHFKPVGTAVVYV